MAQALPFVLLGATGLQAYGQFYSGQAAAQAAQYNSIMAAQNAEIQKRNAEIAGQAGAQQATMQGLKTRAKIGATQANQGASGVSIGQGSGNDVVSSERELGLLDAIQVRNEATRHAYGYQVQAANDTAQSKLDRFQSSTSKTMSYLNAAGTLLSGGAKAYDMYSRYKVNTGIGSAGDDYSGDGNGEW